MPVSLVTPSTSVATSSPKLLADLVERCARVLDGVVQQRRAQRLGVEAHARADLRHADRVHDEVLAGLAPLIGVVLAGEEEGVLDALAVDLDGRVVGVLLDDREQVAEQPALGLGEARREATGACASGCATRSTGTRSAGAWAPLRNTAVGGGLGRVGPRLGGHTQRVPPGSAGATALRPVSYAARAARRGAPRRARPSARRVVYARKAAEPSSSVRRAGASATAAPSTRTSASSSSTRRARPAAAGEGAAATASRQRAVAQGAVHRGGGRAHVVCGFVGPQRVPGLRVAPGQREALVDQRGLGVGRGRVEREHVRVASDERRIALERVPGGDREASEAALEVPRGADGHRHTPRAPARPRPRARPACRPRLPRAGRAGRPRPATSPPRRAAPPPARPARRPRDPRPRPRARLPRAPVPGRGAGPAAARPPRSTR